MKWVKKDNYYIESINKDNSFSISKSMVCDRVFYTLWKLPYNNSTFIFRSENIEDVKHKAIQHYKQQYTSADSKAARPAYSSAREELAGAD